MPREFIFLPWFFFLTNIAIRFLQDIVSCVRRWPPAFSSSGAGQPGTFRHHHNKQPSFTRMWQCGLNPKSRLRSGHNVCAGMGSFSMARWIERLRRILQRNPKCIFIRFPCLLNWSQKEHKKVHPYCPFCSKHVTVQWLQMTHYMHYFHLLLRFTCTLFITASKYQLFKGSLLIYTMGSYTITNRKDS